MTKETERHIMSRTMELKKKVNLICYPKLSPADFGGTNLSLSERIVSDWKFDQDRKKECNARDTRKMEEIA
jgi:hypothetical protein